MRYPMFDRLSAKLIAAFLLAAISGVVLVAVLTYRSASSEFGVFMGHVESMERVMGREMMGAMMGGQPLAQAQEQFLSRIGQTLWIAGLSGAALAILLGALFTRQIVAPLSKVALAARRIARGDLSQRVEIRGSDELAELGSSFNQMAATLKRDQDLRRNMVADIAHELRTPLSILQGNIEAMLDGILPANAENLASLHQEALLLARLVEDLRTLSLAEAGQLSLKPAATDLGELAREVLDGFQTRLAAKSISASLEAPGSLPPAWIDPDRTAQVLRNLLANAIQYTPAGGKISVSLSAQADGIVGSVGDTGAGIPPDDLPKVFDRFYRVDRSRARSSGGSGLGLAIVKQLVEAQGGEVWAESIPEKGSTFYVKVPSAPSELVKTKRGRG